MSERLCFLVCHGAAMQSVFDIGRGARALAGHEGILNVVHHVRIAAREMHVEPYLTLARCKSLMPENSGPGAQQHMVKNFNNRAGVANCANLGSFYSFQNDSRN